MRASRDGHVPQSGARTAAKTCKFATMLLFSGCLFAFAQSKTPNAPASAQAVNQVGYGHLPVTFEQNQGQTDPQVQFVSRGPGYAVYLTSGGMVMALKPTGTVTQQGTEAAASTAAATAATPSGKSSAPAKVNLQVVRFDLVGGAAPNVSGQDLQLGKVNYFVGNDPKKWHTNVPTYGKVLYQGVYPGIDLVYYNHAGQLEHDFVVAPGADPAKIQFEVGGATGLSIDNDGNLLVKTSTGTIQFRTPEIYQETNGAKVSIPGSYTLKDGTHFGFSVPNYDRSKPLTIDPMLVYSTYLGGSSYDYIFGVAVDGTGNAYVTGYSVSPDFPLLSGTWPAGEHTFVAKFDVSGANLLYTSVLAGSCNEQGYGVAVDPTGAASVVGNTCSTNFPTANAYQSTNPSNGWTNYVARLSPDGSALTFSTYFGGPENWCCANQGIGVDANGYTAVGGYTPDQNFPTYNAAIPSVSASPSGFWGNFGWAARFGPTGTLQYSTYLYGNSAGPVSTCWNGSNYYTCYPGTSLSTVWRNIAEDAGGDVYFTAATTAINYPVTSGAYQTSRAANQQYSGVLTKLSPSGGIVYSTYFGDTSGQYTYPYAVTADSSGNAYLTGYTPNAANFPLTSTSLCNPANQTCYGFVSELSADGSTLLYSSYLGPNGQPGYALGIDPTTGNIVVSSYGGTFTPVNGIMSSTSSSNTLVVELNPNNSQIVFATFFGPQDNSSWSPGALAVDSQGGIYVAGYTGADDFPTTQAAFQPQIGSANNEDGFLFKISSANQSAVSISPMALQFATRSVGTTTVARTATLTNFSSVPLNISSISTSGDFAETDNCGTQVAASGGTCSFSVTFTPTAIGQRTGTITIQDDALGTPHYINLEGQGSAPGATFNPTSLTFASTQVGASTASQSVTLTNTGSSTLNISGKALSPADYAETDNCPSSLAIGASCTLNITFTPSVGGADNGSLTVTDDAVGSPQTVALSGSGYVTTASLSTTALTFTNQLLNTTSSAQRVTISNTGANAMTISGVIVSGDFAETDNCTAGPIAANGGTCSVSVTFTPTATGARTGSLTIKDNAQNNPHTVSLTGTGTAPSVSLSPLGLVFTSTVVNSTSSGQMITLTDNGTGALTVSSVATTGDFSETDNCSGQTVAAGGGTCTVNVTFSPKATGSRTGALTITDSASNSPQQALLSGTGIAPNVVLSTNGLTFSKQLINTTSSSQAVTITNNGTASLTISSPAASGDFAQTNNCGTTLAISSSCTVNVTFTPTATGTRTGTLSLTDNAPNSVQSISLTGSGTNSAASLTPNSLTFASQTVGTASAGQSVLLSNTGSAAMTINGIAVFGDFAQTNNCPASLGVGGSCMIVVTFSPAAAGARTGSLQVSDSADAMPQVASLSGSGTVSGITLTPASLAFQAQAIGATSAAQSVTVTNSGASTLNIASIGIDGDFALVSSSCSGAIAPSANCSFSVSFTPSAAGTRTGSAIINSNAPGTNVVALSGSGADFAITASPGSQSVTAGSSATYTLAATSSGGTFSGAINLSCGGLPEDATCSFTPAAVNAGSSTKLVITTKASQTAELRATPVRRSSALLALWMHLGSMGAFGLFFLGGADRKKGVKSVLFLLAILLLVGFAASCGGSSTGGNNATTVPGTPTGSYQVTVIGSAGTMTHTTSLTLTVQ
jgi:Beta-propeller repeat/Abnormal spindle-like microcephaly-assoc'd, ASPM-SPD-2-Hydin